MELYVYYRVAAAQAALARDALEHVQRELRRDWPHLHCRVLRRADAPAGGGSPAEGETWMEIYAGTHRPLAAGELDTLADRLADLPPGRIGPRHSERFLPTVGPTDAAG